MTSEYTCVETANEESNPQTDPEVCMYMYKYVHMCSVSPQVALVKQRQRELQTVGQTGLDMLSKLLLLAIAEVLILTVSGQGRSLTFTDQ